MVAGVAEFDLTITRRLRIVVGMRTVRRMFTSLSGLAMLDEMGDTVSAALMAGVLPLDISKTVRWVLFARRTEMILVESAPDPAPDVTW
jgi:hypothetical protein